ncbi:MAG: isoprenylcysteine carboxylmethyltransferase family protein [Deltaproteobacteria bacterium]|nr:isoprenylcysteine carboxylmethyltransferase family protein [Deltaproteobacteria bacterium]
MNVRIKWIGLINRVATGDRKIRLLLAPAVGLCFFLCAIFFVLLALVTDRRLNLPSFPPAPYHRHLGFPVMAAALLLLTWCVFHFVKKKGTPVPIHPPPVLVASGPYAFTRNPMLTGMFLLLFGLGFVLQSLTLLLIFTPLFILLSVLELKIIEEPELAMRLGRNYLDYRKKTPMFFPKTGCIAKKRRKGL